MERRIYDGSRDKTNFASEKFLELNSAGTQIFPKGIGTVRERGRMDYHILIIAKGTFLVKHGSEVRRLGAGGFAVYCPGEPQGYEALEDGRSYWLHFSGSAAEEVLLSSGLTPGIYPRGCGAGVLRKCSELIGYYLNNNTGMLALATLLELFAELSSGIKDDADTRIPDGVLDSVAYINMNYDKPLTVDELARVSGYSKSRFSHLFALHMNTTPIKYQNKLRIENAKQMLLMGRTSVGEISSLCGFEDQLYFSRAFKKEVGISPTEYREKSSSDN